jgi:outer membrane protein assembly factor BamD
MPIRLLLVVVVVLALAAACGTNKPRLPADQYYKEASTAFASKNYEVAVNRYKELLDQYPFSEHAEEAELRIAQSHYKTKHYPEAIAAFNDFQRMHPMSPHLAKVYYLLGKSYMDQMTTTDRDQAASENAHGWFRVVIDRYPESPWAAKAHRKLGECRSALAAHELYIAAYYFKRQNLRAGENRVKGILENYPDTPVATHAIEHLAAAYARAGDGEHTRLARAALAERASGNPASTDDPPAVGASADPPATRAGADPPATGVRTDPRAIRMVTGQVEVSGPATAALLTDLTSRYGPGQGVSTAATAPSLLDPVQPNKGTHADPRYGPGPNEPPGSY